MSTSVLSKEADIVTFLYRVILKRDPDPEGLKTYVEKLQKKELDVETLAYILYTSEENKQKREFFKESAKLSLFDFLVQIKGTPLYEEINKLSLFSLYSKDVSVDRVIQLRNVEKDSLIVTNHLLPDTFKDLVYVFTTTKDSELYMLNRGFRVIKPSEILSHRFLSCYIPVPEDFDCLGSLVRILDQVCDKIYVFVGNEMLGYLRQRSGKVQKWVRA